MARRRDRDDGGAVGVRSFDSYQLGMDMVAELLEAKFLDPGTRIPVVDAGIRMLKERGLATPMIISAMSVGTDEVLRAIGISNSVIGDIGRRAVDLVIDRTRLARYLNLSAADAERLIKDAQKESLDMLKRAKEKPGIVNPVRTFFHAIEAKLPPFTRTRWFFWQIDVRDSGNIDDFRRLKKAKSLIKKQMNVDEGVKLIEHVMGLPAWFRFQYLDVTLLEEAAQDEAEKKPELLEMLKDAALGRETPWTRDAKARVAAAKQKADALTVQYDNRANAILAAQAVSTSEKVIKLIVVAAIVAGAIVIAVVA